MKKLLRHAVAKKYFTLTILDGWLVGHLATVLALHFIFFLSVGDQFTNKYSSIGILGFIFNTYAVIGGCLLGWIAGITNRPFFIHWIVPEPSIDELRAAKKELVNKKTDILNRYLSQQYEDGIVELRKEIDHIEAIAI